MFETTSDPAAIFALAAAVFLVSPFLSKLVRLPVLVVTILLGALLGPSTLGLLERDATLSLFGTVGLLYLVFIAGLELDLQGFNQYRKRSIIFGLLSFSIPSALTLTFAPLFGFDLLASLLICGIVASHTLLTYPIASRLGLAQDGAVTTVVGGSLLTDTLSLSLLAVVSNMVSGTLSPLFWLRFVGLMALYVAGVVLVIPRMGRWFFNNTDSEASTNYHFLLLALFTSAFLAKLAGAEAIIGAFLAGLTLNRLVPNRSTMMTRVKFFGGAFFIPFFLLSVGLIVDFRVLGSLEVLIITALLSGLVIIGKGSAAFISAKIFGFGWLRGQLMAGLSIPQAAATLAVTFVGLELGLFDTAVVNAVIGLIVVSILSGSLITERAARQVALARANAEEAPIETLQRVLVPIANPATSEALLEVAFLLRRRSDEEFLYPLAVIRDDGNSSSQAAQAERILAHAVVQAAEAEAPVQPITRIANNVASGIVQAARENRITDIIIGWNRPNVASGTVFGSVIDRVLAASDQQVLVCRLKHSVSTSKRLVVVLPPMIGVSPGFFNAIATLKQLANQLNLPLEMLAVEGEIDKLRERIDEVDGEATVNLIRIDGWATLMMRLKANVTPEDLLIIVSSRPGTLAHSATLDRLPSWCAQQELSFIVLYLNEQLLAARLAANRRSDGLPKLLSDKRLFFGLTTRNLAESVELMLGGTFDLSHPDMQYVKRALLEDDVGFAKEHLPQLVIMHARSRAVKKPLAFFGVHPLGVSDAEGETVHGIMILLSPLKLSLQEHLTLLSELTYALARAQGGQALRQVNSFEALRAWFNPERPAAPKTDDDEALELAS